MITIDKKIRIGIIGAGYIGDKHVDAYQYVPTAEVVAIADSRVENATQIAEKIGVIAYQTLDAMLESETLDAIDVCLPTTMHKEAVLSAFRAGLDVIVEKPFALDLEDVDAMIEATRAWKRRLMVAHVCRFMPEYILAKAVVDSKEMGRPLFFGAWRESATPSWSWNHWLHNPALSGGTIMDLQIHDIDLANWLLGTPSSFKAHQVNHPSIQGPSHVVSNIIYANGAMANLEAGHLMPPKYPFSSGFRLLLEGGVIESFFTENQPLEIRIVQEGDMRILSTDDLPSIAGDNPYAEELSHFVGCLLTGAPFRIDVMEARMAVSSVQKLLDSITSKENSDTLTK
ncbi:MAG: Gfo/Idh/MocA family protein [Desulfitobacteriaceae bacterium]